MRNEKEIKGKLNEVCQKIENYEDTDEQEWGTMVGQREALEWVLRIKNDLLTEVERTVKRIEEEAD